jgi:hypothetical protein
MSRLITFRRIQWQNSAQVSHRSDMPGKRNARSRVRGSWAARLTGVSIAIVLAAAGLAAYLIVGARAQNAASLPTQVLGTQAIGLVASLPPSAGSSVAAETLVASRSGLRFAAAAQAAANWTADQMAGGTYIFIYLPDGLCLGASGRAATALQRCNLAAGQRWIRQSPVVGSSGLDYWQLRNMADGRCMTVASAAVQGDGEAGGGPAARLARCQASPGASQLIAFVTTF